MANPLFQRFVDHTASYNLDIQCAMDGTADAEIVIIGEYPGEKEALFNKPFVGGAGNHLWATLRQFGITRNQCYTTNVIKRRVTTTLKVDHTEIVLWQEALHYELSALKPRVIIALGAVALNALTGIDKITQHRGSVYDYKGIPVVAAYNPAYILRMPQHEIVFAMDMEKVSRVLSGSFTQHVINVTYNPTFEDAVDYLTFLNETNSEFAVDIEAVGGETACIGFATSPNRAFVINFRDAKQNRYTLEEEFVILKKFLIACDNPNTIVIAQNGNFDSYFMGYKDHARFQIDFDTLLAHHTLYPRLPHNLGFLTAQYTDHPYYKDEKDAFHEGGDIEQFWEYNGKDAAITFAVAQKQREELKQQGMYDFFTSHVMRVQKHLALPTIDGIAVDTSRRDEIKSTVTQDVKHARSDFYRAVQIATGNDELYVNPNSAPQLRELFFSKLKLTATRKAVDAKTREGWLKDPRVRSEIRDILIALNRFKTADKFLSTYVEVKLSEQNRFHSEYKQFGVSSAPGRLSSGQSFLGPNNTLIGGNAQNLPHQAYEMFITDDPDVVFIYFDLAQAEARYVGWDANIEQWIEDFERARTTPGFDAHRSLAATMFNMPYEDVPTSDYNDDGTHSIRYIAKRCLSPDHQLLTQDGWQDIDKLALTETPIAIWSDGGSMKWETPSDWYIGNEDNMMIEFEGENVSALMTFDHDVCKLRADGTTYRKSAIQCLVEGPHTTQMPMSGCIMSGKAYEYPKLLAAVWADGTVEKNYPNSVRIGVKKQRKKDRLERLLAHHPELRTERYSYDDGMTHYRIFGFTRKQLDYDLLTWDYNSRAAFLNELKYWDGCIKTGRVFNTDYHGLEVIQAVAHITGYACTIRNHGKPRKNEKQCYVIRPKIRKMVTPQHKNIVAYAGKVYCPTVSTGKIMIRRNGKISITCQCRHGLNYRMQPARLAETTGMTHGQAWRNYSLYHNINPELQVWWRTLEREIKKTRMLFNSYGRRLFITERLDADGVLDSIVAFRPQSTIGDKVQRVWAQCHEDPRWDKHRALIRMNVHDALWGMAEKSFAMTALAIMKEYAEEPIMVKSIVTNDVRPLIIPADCKISDTSNDKTLSMDNMKKVEF